MAAWATLAGLKKDMKRAVDDTRDDDELTIQLDAAVAFVEGVHAELYDFTGAGSSTLPPPTPDRVLGTYRLAARWFARRKSPDAVIAMAELGAGRVPSFDPDIDRLLGIGRYMESRFA